ncbi:MAG: hypothetical protein JRN52_03680 [Nitrososphaerota archaeon]|nr:hypothetical protein [Nitrososphaerota archaeon]
MKVRDPMLFSRGEEEIQAISAEGLYEAVPGVSSALGAVSYAGVHLTRRGISSSAAVVTGHEDPSNGRTRVDFRKLASVVDMIVISMGIERLHLISEKLLEAGMTEDTPTAIIESGTRPTHRVRFSTVGGILDADLKDEVVSPALSLREK